MVAPPLVSNGCHANGQFALKTFVRDETRCYLRYLLALLHGREKQAGRSCKFCERWLGGAKLKCQVLAKFQDEEEKKSVSICQWLESTLRKLFRRNGTKQGSANSE